VSAVDEPRFLAPALGYTTNHRAAIDPLEAVDEETQRRLTRQARDDERARLRDEWRLTHDAITQALDHFAVHAPRTLASSIRAVRRSADQLGAKL
jgi:hypothetical protein